MRKEWTGKEINLVREMRRQGKTIGEIANSLGRSSHSVKFRIRHTTDIEKKKAVTNGANIQRKICLTRFLHNWLNEQTRLTGKTQSAIVRDAIRNEIRRTGSK